MASADSTRIQSGVGRLVGVGEAQHESVVAPQRFHFRPAGGADARAHRHRPGNVNAAAEGREHAHAPVAQLVAAPLDHNRPVVGNLARRFGLVGEKAQQIFRGAGIEIVLGDQARERGRPAASARSSRTMAPMRRPNSSGRPGPSPFQNGILPGSPGAGVTSHAVMRNVGNAPRGRAQNERLIGVRLEDHLLVELAHAH